MSTAKVVSHMRLAGVLACILAVGLAGCLGAPDQRGALGTDSADPCDHARAASASNSALRADLFAAPVESIAHAFGAAVDEPWVLADDVAPLRKEGADDRVRWRYQTPTGTIDVRTHEGRFDSLTWTTQRIWPPLDDDQSVAAIAAALEEMGLGDEYLFHLQMETDVQERPVVSDPLDPNNTSDSSLPSELDGPVATSNASHTVALHRGEAVQAHDEKPIRGTGFWFMTTPVPTPFDPNVFILLPAFDLRFVDQRMDEDLGRDLAVLWLGCNDAAPTRSGPCERHVLGTAPRLVVFDDSLAYGYQIVRDEGPRLSCGASTLYLDAQTGSVLGLG